MATMLNLTADASLMLRCAGHCCTWLRIPARCAVADADADAEADADTDADAAT